MSGRGLGLLDLALVAAVAGSVWSRTPVGGLGERALALATGSSRAELPALTTYFLTGPPPEIVEIAQTLPPPAPPPEPAPVPEPPTPGAPPAAGFPEPWRTAAAASQGEAALAALDGLYSGDPALTLEVYALGREQVARAVRRARSAGEARPEDYAAHRRYLPAADARRADSVVTGTMALATVLQLQWPVAPGFAVSSPYGDRVDPLSGEARFHNGLDLAVPEGTPVRSAQAGAVEVSRADGISGEYVVIDHGYGVRTSYCHLSHREVDAGAQLDAGGQLGLSGNTGRSSGPHLHFVLRLGGETLDPARFRPPEER